MDPPKTYLRAPQLDYRPPPEGPIALGNVLSDPQSPHRPIAKISEAFSPALGNSRRLSPSIVRSRGHGGSLSTNVQAYEIVNVDAGIQLDKSMSVEYTMESLETHYYLTDPGEAAIAELKSQAAVQKAMRRPRWSRAVYIVSGLKIAKGLQFAGDRSRNQGIHLTGNVTAVPQVGLGGEIAGSRTKGEKDAYTMDHDVVLAYQLLMMKRSWTGEDVVSELHPEGAFLGDEARVQVEQDVPLAFQYVNAEEFGVPTIE